MKRSRVDDEKAHLYILLWSMYIIQGASVMVDGMMVFVCNSININTSTNIINTNTNIKINKEEMMPIYNIKCTKRGAPFAHDFI